MSNLEVLLDCTGFVRVADGAFCGERKGRKPRVVSRRYRKRCKSPPRRCGDDMAHAGGFHALLKPGDVLVGDLASARSRIWLCSYAAAPKPWSVSTKG